jgi:2-keto-4-pentenoate hydratase
MAPDDPRTKVAPGMRTLLDRRRQELLAGAEAVGWKMGITDPGVQKAIGLPGPVVGYLTDRTSQQVANSDAVAVDLDGYRYPALEVEVAITIGPELTVTALAPALELVDLDVDFHDMVAVLASNVCHKAVLFGPEQPVQDITGLTVEVWPTAGGATEPLAEGRLSEAPGTTIAIAHNPKQGPADGAVRGPGRTACFFQRPLGLNRSIPTNRPPAAGWPH